MISIGEMRNMTLQELAKELEVARHNLFKYRFTVKAGTEKSIHILKQWKKQVSQLQTVISEMKKESKNKSTSNK